jgi:hypothetical protein
LDDARRKIIVAAFRMPLVQTMVQRKSSITNAFVNSVIPVVVPTAEEILEALTILGMVPEDVRCAYCGDQSTEWDHLRPLVHNRRPTGFISEIANLAPSCGKCNQSKGNKAWRPWMLGAAPRSPGGRKIGDLADRIVRLEAYERWRPPTKVAFELILGNEVWEHYWSLCEDINKELREAQTVADKIRATVVERLRQQAPA